MAKYAKKGGWKLQDWLHFLFVLRSPCSVVSARFVRLVCGLRSSAHSVALLGWLSGLLALSALGLFSGCPFGLVGSVQFARLVC